MTPPLFASLPPAAVLVCDAPWQPRDSLPGERGAAHKYETLSVEQLCALELPPRAERHVLLFWRLASMVPEALRVLEAWGYVPASEMVWNKLRPCQTCCATGRVDLYRFGETFVTVPGSSRACADCAGVGGFPMLGLGHYVRGAHEVCIIARARRGRAPERLDKGVPSTFTEPMLCDVDGLLETSCTCGHEKDEHADRGPCFARDEHDRPLACRCVGFTPRRGRLVHSAKPDAFFAAVECLYPGPRVEMFSRRTRPGWVTTTSDQPNRLDEVARVMSEVWPKRERAERLARGRRTA